MQSMLRLAAAALLASLGFATVATAPQSAAIPARAVETFRAVAALPLHLAGRLQDPIGSRDVVVVEARLDTGSFLFAHRMAPDRRLVFVYGNDVTAFRTAEQALRQTERMATLGTLAAGAAHELNNPSAVAARAADQLGEALARLQDTAVALGSADLARMDGAGVRSLINGARRGSVPSGLDSLRRSDVEESVEAWLQASFAGSVEVRHEYVPDLPRIEAVGGELNQVWTHLVQNAVDAMAGRGRLVIRARHEGQCVAVDIEDDGSGIPERVRPRIFDAFFTTKPPGKGTGMGLATCHNIVVKNHGGTIDLVSAPGRTCVTVRLPINRPA